MNKTKSLRSARGSAPMVTLVVTLALIAPTVVGVVGPPVVRTDTLAIDGSSDPFVASILAAAEDAGGESDLERALRVAQVALDERAGLLADTLPEELRHTADIESRNLALATALLDTTYRDDAPRLARAVEAAQLATKWQAATVNQEWVDAPLIVDAIAPSRALASLMEWHGASLDADQALALDALPEPLRQALSRTILAFTLFSDATVQGARGVDLEVLAETDADGIPTDRALAETTKLNPAPVLAARSQLLDATLKLADAMRATPLEVLEAVPDIEEAPYVVIRLAPKDDLHNRDVHLLIDGGGNDRYYNNAGGNRVMGGCSSDIVVPTPAPLGQYDLRDPPTSAALIDLGSGNDGYNKNLGRSCGVNGGAALGGSGFLFDEAGDDIYHGVYGGFNGGAGSAGVGFLFDGDGNDTYSYPPQAPGHSRLGSIANGGASGGGLGMLIDGGGDDLYAVGPMVTNGGAIEGVGFLFDIDGDDVYRAGRPDSPYAPNGVNGGASNPWCCNMRPSIGFLLDAGGNDQYIVDHTDRAAFAEDGGGNGGGTNGGIGFLLDAGGDDLFHAKQGVGMNGGAAYYTPAVERKYAREVPGSLAFAGKGTSTARGFVLAVGGDDTFLAQSGGVNGGGHKGGHGLLVTGGGNTSYDGERSGVNGGGGFAGRGLLVDLDGDDTYTGDTGAVNGGGYGGIGRLIDRAGDDNYSAVKGGVNGGAQFLDGACITYVTPAIPGVPRIGVSTCQLPSQGLLFDAGGSDRYADSETDSEYQGSGDDRTVIPKGTIGAQVDHE